MVVVWDCTALTKTIATGRGSNIKSVTWSSPVSVTPARIRLIHQANRPCGENK